MKLKLRKYILYFIDVLERMYLNFSNQLNDLSFSMQDFHKNHWHTAFICVDCGVNTMDIGHYYMIDDELWDSITDKYDKKLMLCLPCVDDRVLNLRGHHLGWDSSDFKPDTPINQMLFERMGRE